MANTYTSSLGAAEGRIQSLTQAVSSGISGLPGINDALRKAVMEREKTLPGLEQENEAKIKELYSADKRYAETYANPESGMYIENPMQRQGLVSGQKADIRGELGNILNLIQSRQQTMGNAIDKGMELYKMGLEAQKIELEQAEKTWSRIMEKMKFSESQKGSAGDREVNAARTAMQKDIAGYTTFENLTKRYGGVLEPYEIRQSYNAFHNKQNYEPWGPATEGESTVTGWLNPPNDSTTQWKTKQSVYQEAYKAKQSGASQQEISSYIQAQGFDPTDPDFVSLNI